jgi:fatty acid desaturase
MCTMNLVMNYWAILVAAIVFWVLGSVWFSVLFKKSWKSGQSKLGLKMHKPSPSEMKKKLVISFLLNLVQVWGIAALVSGFQIMTIQPAICVGLLTGVCFAAASMACKSLWENHGLKLTCIDMGYPVVGFVVSAIILALWQ